MRPPSSSSHNAAGSRGAPATSAGCENRPIERPGPPGPERRTTTPSNHCKGLTHNRPHTLRRSSARTDDAFPLAVRGANAMAGARPHRAEPGARRARARRREVPCGSALHSRRRWPSMLLLFQLYSRRCSAVDPAWAQATRHEAVGSHQGADLQHAVRINDKLMSYSQARKVAQEVTYANAVEAAQRGHLLQRPVLVPGGRGPGEHHPGVMDADSHLRRGRERQPVCRLLRHPRVERL